MEQISFGQERKWHDIEQNTDAWLDLRMGRVGGSAIGKVMANYGKAFGKPAHDVALKIALERITGTRVDQSYTNDHMERGHEQEPIARQLYEETTFTEVGNGGFFECGELIGVSPDGISNVGLIEIKSVIGSVHFETVKRGAFDPKYKWQMLLGMGGSGLPWIDYVEYCSEFPEGKKLFIQRLNIGDYSEDMIKITMRLNEFNGLIDDKIKLIESL